jgi:hypothetical protein
VPRTSFIVASVGQLDLRAGLHALLTWPAMTPGNMRDWIFQWSSLDAKMNGDTRLKLLKRIGLLK